jgi:hypothetical protein
MTGIILRTSNYRQFSFKPQNYYFTLLSNYPVRTALFRNMTQRRTVVPYRSFDPTCWPNLLGSVVPSLSRIVGTEFQCALRQIPKESRYPLHHDGSLMSLIILLVESYRNVAFRLILSIILFPPNPVANDKTLLDVKKCLRPANRICNISI